MEILHNCISETKVSLTDWAFHHNFGKDSDDEVVTEQLTAVVDVTFKSHDTPNSLESHEIY